MLLTMSAWTAPPEDEESGRKVELFATYSCSVKSTNAFCDKVGRTIPKPRVTEESVYRLGPHVASSSGTMNVKPHRLIVETVTVVLKNGFVLSAVLSKNIAFADGLLEGEADGAATAFRSMNRKQDHIMCGKISFIECRRLTTGEVSSSSPDIADIRSCLTIVNYNMSSPDTM